MYYFAYASNLNRRQMQERCPESRPKQAAILHHYQLVFEGWSRQWRGATANIRPIRGGKVRGAIYEMPEKCLKRLDKYLPDYRQLSIIVNNEDNEPIEAITHIRSGQGEQAKPSAEYLAVIHKGYKEWRLM